MDEQRMNRRGRILISDKLTRNNEIPYVFYKIGFLPVRVEFLYAQISFEYIGISDLFDTVEEGEMIPTYVIKIDKNKKGDIANAQVERVVNG